MKIFARIVLCACLVPFPSMAQPVPVATQMETFSSQTGIVTIVSEEHVGFIGSAVDGGRLNVSARKIINVRTKLEVTGLFFLLTSGRSERTAFIDFDELQGLLDGLNYIAKFDPQQIKGFKSNEVIFRTKSGLRLSVFNTAKGRELAVSSGGLDIYLGNELGRLQAIITQAKAMLDNIR